MDHYFFDWRDKDVLEVDDLGIDLPDLQAVKREAAKALIEQAHDMMPVSEFHTVSIEVRHQNGRRVLSVALILEIHTLA